METPMIVTSPKSKSVWANQPVLQAIMPRHMTEVVMLEEMAETVAELNEVSMPEQVAHEAGNGWEECLRTAQRQQRIREVALLGNLPLEPLVCVKRMMEEEKITLRHGR